MRKRKQFGATLVEACIVLSILSSLAILAAPTIAKTKRDAYVLQCKAQMQELGVALIKYRDDHQGKMPHDLGEIILLQQVEASKLICPFTHAVAPAPVSVWREFLKKRGENPNFPGCSNWSSYRYVSPALVGLQNRSAPDKTPFTHADLLSKRGTETPMLICRDHREPFSLDFFLGSTTPRPRIGDLPNPPYPLWDYPEDDVVVLRWDGRATTTKKGGSRLTKSFVSTANDYLEL